MTPHDEPALGRGSLGDFTQAIKAEARRIGFLAVGITLPEALNSRSRDLARWIKKGYSGSLGYMEAFFERQSDFLSRIPDLKSIIVVAASCGRPEKNKMPKKGAGRIARYAWGRDYHQVVQKRLERLESEGSFVFLAALLTNLDLIPDAPIQWDCGACTLCLQACPTQALVRPYELDARRCISTLTIESKDKEIAPKRRPLIGEWAFGCDICQEVCPYNRSSDGGPSAWEEFQPEQGVGQSLSLSDILMCRSEDVFLQRFAGTPLMRIKRVGLLRNAAIVAGNLADPRLVPSLTAALKEDLSPVVRGHAAWALRQIAKNSRALFRNIPPA